MKQDDTMRQMVMTGLCLAAVVVYLGGSVVPGASAPAAPAPTQAEAAPDTDAADAAGVHDDAGFKGGASGGMPDSFDDMRVEDLDDEDVDLGGFDAAATSAAAAGGAGDGMVPTILVSVCQGWQYAKNFRLFKAFLEREVPELQGHVHGTNQEPPFPIGLLASLAGYAQIAGFAFMIFGTRMFSGLGMAVPPLAVLAEAHKGKVMIGLYVANMVLTQMSQTGAFEVQVLRSLPDGRATMEGARTLYSKLASGRLPGDADLRGIISTLSRDYGLSSAGSIDGGRGAGFHAPHTGHAAM